MVSLNEMVAKSTACFGVEDNKTVTFSGRMDQTEAREERVGDKVRVSPTGVTVGAWTMSLEVVEAGGK